MLVGDGAGFAGCGAMLEVVCGSAGVAVCVVRWTRARDDDPRTPHERAIDGPAVKPIKAPATAPTGPSTTAPDTAPSAASPARSCALTSNETSAPAISVATRTILMASSLPASPRRSGKCGGRKEVRLDTGTKYPVSALRARLFGVFDVTNVAVICPTCQRSRFMDQVPVQRSRFHAPG
jgi:hypothetical protein